MDGEDQKTYGFTIMSLSIKILDLLTGYIHCNITYIRPKTHFLGEIKKKKKIEVDSF